MIFLNQKMNLTKNELKEFIENIKVNEVVLFPTMPLLGYASELYNNIGSQDVSMFECGPYTGQTGIKTLKSLNVKYCLIGHSEKREYLNETTENIIRKIELCVENDITPIFIIGEKEENNKVETIQFLEKQITEVFNNIHCDLNNIIIAYEPIWNIGKKTIDIKYINDLIYSLKSLIKDYYDVNLPIIYGGGINSKNIEMLTEMKNLDGYLIGSSSLDYEEIEQILNKLN